MEKTMSGMTRCFSNLTVLASLLLLSACAASGEKRVAGDPLEPVNRQVFAFNEAVDGYFLRPVAQGYQTVTPQPARTQVSNFFGNLEDVWIGFNNLIQGKPRDAGSDIGRFLINSTVGILGFFDVASELGLSKNDEDFGQTLGKWGVGEGPYVVLPLFGPRTLRDSGALIVDSAASVTSEIDPVATRNAVRGLKLVNDRASLLGADTTLDEAALDKYSYMRDFHLQRRRSQVNDGKRVRPREDE